MNFSSLLIIVIIVLGGAYFLGRNRARAISNQGVRMHSLPDHYGTLMALWTGVPALILLLTWHLLEGPVINHLLVAQLPAAIQQADSSTIQLTISKVYNLASASGIAADPSLLPAVEHLTALNERTLILNSGIALSLCLVCFVITFRRIKPELRARSEMERIVNLLLLSSSGIAVLTTVGILASVMFEAWMFFQQVNPLEFLFGTTWSPQVALRADQSGSSGSFGAVPLFAGTLLISSIAMIIAVPVGLMAAIYLSEYASSNVRKYAKPALEVLAGIPTVVYGFFAALTVAPFIRALGTDLGLEVSSESALAAGLVMGVMLSLIHI